MLKSAAIRARILEVLTSWLGAPPRVLENAAPDLAVARGAAYYGLARRGAGAAHHAAARRARYYLGIDTAQVTPGQVTVLCLTPRGFEEGAEVTLSEHALELLTNRPVRFRLFSSSDRVGDRAGQLLTLPPDALAELPPMYTVLRFARSSHETALSVNLRARLTEIGTLELECVARATGNEQHDRWKLQFDLRATRRRVGASAASVSPGGRRRPIDVDPQKIEQAIARACARSTARTRRRRRCRRRRDEARCRRSLGPRDGWSFTDAARAVGAAQGSARRPRQVGGARGALVNLVGYTLRPGLRLSARRLARQGDVAPVQRRPRPRQGRSRASSSGGSCGGASRAG